MTVFLAPCGDNGGQIFNLVLLVVADGNAVGHGVGSVSAYVGIRFIITYKFVFVKAEKSGARSICEYKYKIIPIFAFRPGPV